MKLWNVPVLTNGFVKRKTKMNEWIIHNYLMTQNFIYNDSACHSLTKMQRSLKLTRGNKFVVIVLKFEKFFFCLRMSKLVCFCSFTLWMCDECFCFKLFCSKMLCFLPGTKLFIFLFKVSNIPFTLIRVGRFKKEWTSTERKETKKTWRKHRNT